METKTSIHAVVLAGGYGKRLSPLTDSKPKPLMRVLDTTILENILEKLILLDNVHITVSTHYKSEQIEKVCEKYKPKVVCKREMISLGTAGGVKYCYDGKSECVLVVSGDAVFDFNLQNVVDFHLQNKNEVTIVTSRKENPTEYGVVVCDDESNITEFCEKPCWKRVKSDRVNTGIYVLSKRVMDEIPEGIAYDFSKSLFPLLMQQGIKLAAFQQDGFWCDVGTFDELHACNILAAKGGFSYKGGDGHNAETLRKWGIHAQNGTYVSKKAEIGMNVSIVDSSVVCEGCTVSDNCDISCSVIGKDCYIGKGTSISKSLLGDGVFIGENCVIPPGCVISDGVSITEGTVLGKNRRISPYKTVNSEDEMGEFSQKGIVFVNDGKAMLEKGNMYENVTNFAVALSVFAKRSDGEKISVAVMSREKNCNVKNILKSGFMTVGVDFFDLGHGSLPTCMYACTSVFCDLYVYTERCENRIFATVLDRDGKLLPDDDERKVTRAYLSVCDAEEEQILNEPGEYVSVPTSEIYNSALAVSLKRIVNPDAFSDFDIFIPQRHNLGIYDNFADVYKSMGGKISSGVSGETMSLLFSDEGTQITLKCSDIQLDKNHMCAVIVKNCEILGLGEIYLDESMPYSVRNLVPNGVGIKKKRTDILDNFYGDACVCFALFLSVASLKCESIKELVSSVPAFEVYADEYIADVNRGATMERLSVLYRNSKNSEYGGINLCLSGGNVTVIPNRAKGFKIVAEAVSMEAAKELAFKIGKAIKNDE